jgi:hypothetical protein
MSDARERILAAAEKLFASAASTGRPPRGSPDRDQRQPPDALATLISDGLRSR